MINRENVSIDDLSQSLGKIKNEKETYAMLV